jgi:hypothetical protein
MSYPSENVLARGTRIAEVREFVGLLGFKRGGALNSEDVGKIEEFYWFVEDEYKSWSGVELGLYKNDEKRVVVETRTPVGRSYFDLKHQNLTISSIRKRFGGTSRTDEGKGRYLKPEFGPPPAPASGCFLAFSRFGGNLIRAKLYHDARAFPNHPSGGWRGPLADFSPEIVANNTLVPFLVAACEEYFKSTWIALVRYSPKKQAIFRGFRLQGDQLLAISNRQRSVEEQIAESMGFQRVSVVCRNFEQLDAKLDLAGVLRKPYRRRKLSLFDSIEHLVTVRHDLIHRAIIDTTMTDGRAEGPIYDLEVVSERVYRRITDHYGWFFDKGWFLGRKPAGKSRVTAAPLRRSS